MFSRHDPRIASDDAPEGKSLWIYSLDVYCRDDVSEMPKGRTGPGAATHICGRSGKASCRISGFHPRKQPRGDKGTVGRNVKDLSLGAGARRRLG